MENTTKTLYRNRIFILLIITFASVADLMVLFLTSKGFFSIYKLFLMYAVVFILQETFKFFRAVMLFLLAAALFLGLLKLLAAVNLHSLQDFFLNKILVPAAMPLYLSMGCITVLAYLFLRRYKVFR